MQNIVEEEFAATQHQEYYDIADLEFIDYSELVGDPNIIEKINKVESEIVNEENKENIILITIKSEEPHNKPIETIKPIKTETIKPIKTETIKPIKTETIKPIKTETIKPIETETITPIETETITPIETETITPIETETITPIETETIPPIDRECYTIKEEPISPEYESSHEEIAPTKEPPAARPVSVRQVSKNGTESILESERNSAYYSCSNCPMKSVARAWKLFCRLCREPVRYHCEPCNQTFELVYDLASHLRTFHGTENKVVHQCPSCRDVLYSSADMTNHRGHCGKVQPLKCESCYYTTKYTTLLKNHLLIAHNHEVLPKEPVQETSDIYPWNKHPPIFK